MWKGQAGTVRGAVEDMSDYLLGRDPLQIEDIWQTLFRGRFYRGGPVMMSAIAGVNQALWDIKGKYHGAPVYDLLGGKVRDRVQIYAGVHGDSPEEVARQALRCKQEGLRAIKMGAVPGYSLRRRIPTY